MHSSFAYAACPQWLHELERRVYFLEVLSNIIFNVIQKVTEEVIICISIILLWQYYKIQMGTLFQTGLFLWQQCCIV
jgi:hypothetical protein